MLNQISELSKETFSNRVTPKQLDAGPIESLLDDGESLQDVLSSTSGIEHTTDGRTTTIEPSGDRAAYAVLTDERVYFLLGDDPTTPEITLHLGAITQSKLVDGFLRTTLSLQTDEESIQFFPDDTEKAVAVEAYVDRIGSCWADLEAALASARQTIEEFRAAVESGDHTARIRQQARSRISKAHHYATHEDDAPTHLMTDLIEPVETELDRLCTAAESDCVESLLDDARHAHERSNYDTAFESIVEAHEIIDDGRGAVDDDALSERLATFETRRSELATTFVGHAEDVCYNALAADTPADAVANWNDALERYRAALAAGWDGAAEVSADALRFQLAWVVQNLVDALAETADVLETEGDELGEAHDESVDRYEAALSHFGRARTLASEHPHASGDAFDDRIDALESKVERARWQWGSAD